MAGMNEAAIRDIPGGVSIRVHVAPRASRNKVLGVHDGALKVALTAPPVEGAANRALVEFMTKIVGVPKSAVSILSGEASRHKVVEVMGTTVEDVKRRLAPEVEVADE
jgi:uncharacterized protein (TIGR00251 family)